MMSPLQLFFTVRRTHLYHPVLIAFLQTIPVQALLYFPAKLRHPIAFYILITALSITDIFHSGFISPAFVLKRNFSVMGNQGS